MQPLKRVTVVLPLVPGARTDWTGRIVERLREAGGFELVCPVSHPEGAARVPKGYGARIVTARGNSRAARLQAGIDAASCGCVLLHHPRSLIDPEGLRWLNEHAGEVSWGGFTHSFDHGHPLLRFASWYSNKIRAGLRGILYLDHCIFFQRTLLTLPVPEVEIFEDTELSLILRRSGPPRLLPYRSTTSAVRFLKNGILRQSLLNQSLKLQYLLGYSDRGMNKRYERGLRLNG